jgi:hypothetical protein
MLKWYEPCISHLTNGLDVVACRCSGNVSLVDGLLMQGVSPNQRHEHGACTPLIACAYMGHMHVLERQELRLKFTTPDHAQSQVEARLMIL